MLRPVSVVSTERDLRIPNNDRFEPLCGLGTVASIESNAFAIRRTDGCPPRASSSRRIL